MEDLTLTAVSLLLSALILIFVRSAKGDLTGPDQVSDELIRDALKTANKKM